MFKIDFQENTHLNKDFVNALWMYLYAVQLLFFHISFITSVLQIIELHAFFLYKYHHQKYFLMFRYVQVPYPYDENRTPQPLKERTVFSTNT